MCKFAIAIPTYKRANELQKLLDSLDVKCTVYVSDNGGYLPENFPRRNPNISIKKTTPEVPIFSNWNAAACMVKEEWLTIPADDDLYYPESFQIINRYISTYPEMDVIIFGHNVIDVEGKTISSWIPRELAAFNAPEGFRIFQYGVEARMPSVFVKTKLFHELGGFEEGFKLTAGDSDFVQRALLAGNVLFVPEVVSGYRVWEGGLTSSRMATNQWMNEIDSWCKRIATFCKERSIDLYSKKNHDEIYALNLLGGVMNLKKKRAYLAAWSHFWSCRYPVHASLLTQLRLFYILIKP